MDRTRPAGRSGCVTTETTSKSGAVMSWRRDGTAKSGVPMKTIRLWDVAMVLYSLRHEPAWIIRFKKTRNSVWFLAMNYAKIPSIW